MSAIPENCQTRFGMAARQLLAGAHEIFRQATYTPDGPMYVTQVPRSEKFLITPFGDLSRFRPRLLARPDPQFDWVFEEAPRWMDLIEE